MRRLLAIPLGALALASAVLAASASPARAREVHSRDTKAAWSEGPAGSYAGSIPNDTGYSFWLLPRSLDRPRFTVSARLRFRSHVDYGGAGIAVVDPAASEARHPHFRFEISEREDRCGIGGWLEVKEQHYPAPASKPCGRDIKPGEWYHLGVSVEGKKATASLDGKPIVSGEIEALSSLPGSLALAVFIIEADAEFADIKIVAGSGDAREFHSRDTKGRWTAGSGTTQGSIPNDTGWSFYPLPRAVDRSRFAVSTHVRFRSHVDYGGAGIAVVDPASNSERHPHFRFEISEREDRCGIGGWLESKEQHYPAPASKPCGRDIKPGEWYRLDLRVEGRKAAASLDGREIVAGEVSALDSLPASLSPALFVIEADAEFADIERPPGAISREDADSGAGSAAGPDSSAAALGPAASAPAGCNGFAGRWDTGLGILTLALDGEKVTGSLFGGKAELTGRAADGVLEASWGDESQKNGRLKVELSVDGRSLVGTYSLGGVSLGLELKGRCVGAR